MHVHFKKNKQIVNIWSEKKTHMKTQGMGHQGGIYHYVKTQNSPDSFVRDRIMYIMYVYINGTWLQRKLLIGSCMITARGFLVMVVRQEMTKIHAAGILRRKQKGLHVL